MYLGFYASLGGFTQPHANPFSEWVAHNPHGSHFREVCMQASPTSMKTLFTGVCMQALGIVGNPMKAPFQREFVQPHANLFWRGLQATPMKTFLDRGLHASSGDCTQSHANSFTGIPMQALGVAHNTHASPVQALFRGVCMQPPCKLFLTGLSMQAPLKSFMKRGCL